jgi:putative ATP-dependent endonuclease of OLD family
MKLLRVIIRNFRSYKEEVQIPIDQFTAFIGKNDVGKSTILEALEIFFNNSTVKIDQSDSCVFTDDNKVLIGCVFSDLPEQVILDSQTPTTFAQEYLLNSNGELEIHKLYDCSLKTPKATVHAFSHHPINDGLSDLLRLKITDLKKRSRDLEVDLSVVDQRSNPSLRQAIRNQFEELQFEEKLLALNDENAKSVWESIEKILPQYALFQADRSSNDEDSEVQNPMKYAVNEALKNVEDELNRIKEFVHSQVMEVATRTLDKLRLMDPTLANELAPHFKTEPKWDSLFKLSLTSDDQIPINKRGSGVRRLILLNFFRAEAERKQVESGSPGIIYAIEEPETAQHPNNQKMLVEALTQLSLTDNCQVIVTTHVPGLAGLLDVKSLRYIETLPDGRRHISYGHDGFYKKIADQLGVMPDSRIKLFVCVEGPHDVRFLNHISRILHEVNPMFPKLESDPRIAMFHLGGSTLKDWVLNHYLKGLGIPEIHIYDRDDGPNPKYQIQSASINRRGDGSIAFNTGKREMENYIHPDSISQEYGFELSFTDMDDVPELVAKTQHEQTGEFPWDTLSDEKKKKKTSRAKARLNIEIAARMTYDQLCAADPNRDVESWMHAIYVILNHGEVLDMVAIGAASEVDVISHL